MPIRLVRLGVVRTFEEGRRIGTVRRLPRGVPKTDILRELPSERGADSA